MKKKMATLLALSTITTCAATVGVVTFMAQNVSADNTQSLVFTGVTMDGGLDWTATANANNPTNTNWGNALGLAFSTNIYDIGAVYQEDIQDKVTTISDGNGGYLTNKQLVTYTEADGTTDRYIDVIWYDTQGNLVFRTNDYPWDTSYSTYTEERTGLPYYAYGDGDMVTVKAGFTFTYNDGTQDKDLVLANDVTVQYDLETNSWNEVVKQGATAQIKFASADNVTVSTYNGADGKSWGYLIDLFKGSRPAGFTSVTTDYTVCGLKESAKTELDSWGAKMFSLNANYVKYYNADGTEDPLAAIYYTTSGVVIRTSSESTSIASPLDGEKIYIKKGFRDAYYYGKIHEWATVPYAQEHQGGLQSLATIEEDILFVYRANTGVWEKIVLAPSNLDFADNIKSLSQIYKGQTINIFQYTKAGVTEIPKVSSSDSEVISVSDAGIITGGEKAGSATITLQFTNTTIALTLENVVITPKVEGANITIGETIVVNYYVTLPIECVGATMRFTMAGKTTDEVAGKLQSNLTYKYSFEVPPQCMADEIDAEVVFDNEVIASKYDYSVQQYAKNKLSDSPSDALKQLITDMLYYGNAAQNYLQYNTDNLAMQGVENLGTPSTATPESTVFALEKNSEIDTYPAYFTGAGVWFDGVNRLYVKINTTENVTLTINGETVDVTDTVVYTDGIMAKDFGDTYTFVLSYNGQVMQTLTYSVNSYVYQMKDNATMGELALALYRYGASAVAYVG